MPTPTQNRSRTTMRATAATGATTASPSSTSSADASSSTLASTLAATSASTAAARSSSARTATSPSTTAAQAFPGVDAPRAPFGGAGDGSAAAAVAAQAPRAGGGGGARARLAAEAGKRTRSPEAATALAIYGSKKDDVHRPFERVLVHAARLHAALDHDVDAVLEPKAANQARKQAFMMEGLLRFSDGVGAPKRLAAALVEVKELEDALGAFDHALAMQAEGRAHGIDPRAQAVLDQHVVAAREAARAVLQDGWLPRGGKSAKLEDVVDAFRRADLGKSKKDAARARARLVEIVRGVEEKAGRLDMTKLEKGLHELRRALRWIPISMMALDGLVVLEDDTKTKPRFEALRDDPVAKSPFARLPPSTHEKDAIAVPRALFLALSKAIADLGALKDEGQVVAGLAEALEEAGLAASKREARAAVEVLVGEPGRLDRVHRVGEEMRDALLASGLLPDLAASLEQ